MWYSKMGYLNDKVVYMSLTTQTFDEMYYLPIMITHSEDIQVRRKQKRYSINCSFGKKAARTYITMYKAAILV